MGLHELVQKSASFCDVEARRDLLSNVVVCGGTSMLTGFIERLQKEIFALTSLNRLWIFFFFLILPFFVNFIYSFYLFLIIPPLSRIESHHPQLQRRKTFQRLVGRKYFGQFGVLSTTLDLKRRIW